MYEKLIKALLWCEFGWSARTCDNCEYSKTDCQLLLSDAAAAIEALQADNDILHQHIEDLNEAFRSESLARQKAEVAQPHWVSVEEPPKRNDTVLVRDNGYRVLTYLGDGRWEDDYGYGAEFVSDDAEWCYIEPPQEVQE